MLQYLRTVAVRTTRMIAWSVPCKFARERGETQKLPLVRGQVLLALPPVLNGAQVRQERPVKRCANHLATRAR